MTLDPHSYQEEAQTSHRSCRSAVFAKTRENNLCKANGSRNQPNYFIRFARRLLKCSGPSFLTNCAQKALTQRIRETCAPQRTPRVTLPVAKPLHNMSEPWVARGLAGIPLRFACVLCDICSASGFNRALVAFGCPGSHQMLEEDREAT